MKIAIIDYGMGNIKSIVGALKYLGSTDIILTNEFDDIKNSDKLILPGVGSFKCAMENIRTKNLDLYLNEVVLKDKKPILGICLGMQLMGKSSTEEGNTFGLNFVDGLVTKFNFSNLRIPHVGFNQIQVNRNSKLYEDIDDNVDFYFTHSYKMNTGSDINQAICNYGNDFIASFEIENICGVQFHPELSQTNGLKLLKNFIEKF